MKDYTAAVIRLENSYQSMQLARKRVADEVKMEYRALMRDEIARRQKAAEAQFARDLATEHAGGMPGNVIREHVLHTQDWSRWKKWRDLAGIDPDRVTVQDAKRAAQLENATFLWSEDYAILTVKRNSLGHVLPEPVTYNMANLKKRDKKWNPIPDDEELYISTIHADEPYAFGKMVNAEIQRQIDAGHVRPNEGEQS